MTEVKVQTEQIAGNLKFKYVLKASDDCQVCLCVAPDEELVLGAEYG